MLNAKNVMWLFMMRAGKLIQMGSQRTVFTLKFNTLGQNFMDLMKRIYVISWHNLSLDERVRESPFDDPPENEVKMNGISVFYYRANRIGFLLLHIYGLIGLYDCIKGKVMIQTIIFAVVLAVITHLGIICGTHRMWSHNAFKAVWPIRLFLMLCQTLSLQYDIYLWCQLHRLHHKYSDTPLDPHNPGRSFFFSYIGWLLIQKTPEVKEELKKIYMDDLRKDKIVMFQHKYILGMAPIFAVIIPTLIPWYQWNEHLYIALKVAVALRLLYTFTMLFLINSIAHRWGMKPFDKTIPPTDNRFLHVYSLGDEGWHNYHHAFPWDYKASEFWGYKAGLGVLFIEFCARRGWAYNLKQTSVDVMARKRQKNGDLSCNVWGWNDKNKDPVDVAVTKITFKKNNMR